MATLWRTSLRRMQRIFQGKNLGASDYFLRVKSSQASISMLDNLHGIHIASTYYRTVLSIPSRLNDVFFPFSVQCKRMHNMFVSEIKAVQLTRKQEHIALIVVIKNVSLLECVEMVSLNLSYFFSTCFTQRKKYCINGVYSHGDLNRLWRFVTDSRVCSFVRVIVTSCKQRSNLMSST